MPVTLAVEARLEESVGEIKEAVDNARKLEILNQKVKNLVLIADGVIEG